MGSAISPARHYERPPDETATERERRLGVGRGQGVSDEAVPPGHRRAAKPVPKPCDVRIAPPDRQPEPSDRHYHPDQ
jgi:hypothetical protein